MDNKIFNKYVKTILFFERNNKNNETLLMDLHFPWEVKILSARYQPSIASGRLVFINKGVEIETSFTYPYLPFAIIFPDDKTKNNAEFWYKLEANEKNQIILLSMDTKITPEYLLSRKAEIIREAILEQLNLEKFSDEFNQNVLNKFIL